MVDWRNMPGEGLVGESDSPGCDGTGSGMRVIYTGAGRSYSLGETFCVNVLALL